MRTGKNHEGYSDPTASCAVGHLTHEEKQREKKRCGNKSNMLGSTHPDSSVNHNADRVPLRNEHVLSLPTERRKGKEGIHRGTEKERRRTASGHQRNARKERRKEAEKAAKKE